MIATSIPTKLTPWQRDAAFLAVVASLACAPAQARTFVDELTYYLTADTFSPGGLATTTVTFATKPGISLSAFSFEMTWSSPLVTPLPSGQGSLASWGESLASRGNFTLGQVQALSVSGRWVASALAPSPDVIPIPYAHPLQPVFSLQTAPELASSFVVSFQFYDIADGAGDMVDTGSGFINWATMTPVHEPQAVLLWLCGAMAAAAGWAGRGRRMPRPVVGSDEPQGVGVESGNAGQHGRHFGG